MNNKKYNNLSRISFRLSDKEEQDKLLELFYNSNAKNLTDFIRKKLLDKHFFVTSRNASIDEINNYLSEIIFQIRKIGTNINQATNILNQKREDYPTLKLSKIIIENQQKLDPIIHELHRIITILKKQK